MRSAAVAIAEAVAPARHADQVPDHDAKYGRRADHHRHHVEDSKVRHRPAKSVERSGLPGEEAWRDEVGAKNHRKPEARNPTERLKSERQVALLSPRGWIRREQPAPKKRTMPEHSLAQPAVEPEYYPMPQGGSSGRAFEGPKPVRWAGRRAKGPSAGPEPKSLAGQTRGRRSEAKAWPRNPSPGAQEEGPKRTGLRPSARRWLSLGWGGSPQG